VLAGLIKEAKKLLVFGLHRKRRGKTRHIIAFFYWISPT